jgi:hypothetical protein
LKLTPSEKLLAIKTLHSLIWCFFVTAIGYVVYAGISGTINMLVLICIGLIMLEGIVLWINDGRCPLTPMAARYTEPVRDNFDIFLPEWLARNNKVIFTSIFAFGFVLVLIRVLS